VRKRTELGTLLQHQGARGSARLGMDGARPLTLSVRGIGSVTALRFHAQTHLLSASEDGTVAVYRTSDWECLKVLRGHKYVGRCVSVSLSLCVRVCARANYTRGGGGAGVPC
jgi:WD40 repeat protein